MHKAVFLDRDGVINRAIVRDGKPYPPNNPEEMELLPGVPEAVSSLHQAGWLLIVVTNQPDVSRGTTTREVVEEINNRISQKLPIKEFKTCYHDTADFCECRKPKPGALISAARDHGIDLSESYMVGDRWRDVEAGERAGCKTIYIDCGYAEKEPRNFDYRVHSLADAAHIILGYCHEKN
jgi:D-glycero-D-manno-heptose 1,7-bisphosphate phosphatase